MCEPEGWESLKRLIGASKLPPKNLLRIRVTPWKRDARSQMRRGGPSVQGTWCNVSARLNAARQGSSRPAAWHRPESEQYELFIGFYPLSVAVSLRLNSLETLSSFSHGTLGADLSLEKLGNICLSPLRCHHHIREQHLACPNRTTSRTDSYFLG